MKILYGNCSLVMLSDIVVFELIQNNITAVYDIFIII